MMAERPGEVPGKEGEGEDPEDGEGGIGDEVASCGEWRGEIVD